jgi:two-component system chemotaxis sensor kinase CheA
MGSALIEGRITLFINIYDIFQALNPEWFEKRSSPATPDGKDFTILIVEDSNFFRNQVKSFLEAENYQIMEAEDGLVALDLLAKHIDTISMVVTDIEMPNLDGFGLTEEIKSQKEYCHLPVIALTTLAGEKDINRGREMGIDNYLIKLDKENLLVTVNELLNSQH